MCFNQNEFGHRLKKLRKECGFTQEQLATAVNISTVHLGNIEMGKRGISVDLLIELADALDVSIDFLTRGVIRTSPRTKSLLSDMRDILNELEILMQNPS